jgi:DNA-binding FadR family transcriptional regulator
MRSILNLLMERGRLADQIPDARGREWSDHEQLLATLRRRDPVKSRQAMLDHIVAWAGTYDGSSATALEQMARDWSN